MIGRRRLTGSVATALLAAVLLTACSGQNQSDDDGLATFSSMDDAYAAVDEVLQCEADPAGRPIVPADEGKLTSEQRLTDVATGEPSTWDIERVADELNGEYSAVGS
ncbi:hypothetical protein [Arthrobacter parietis]